MSPPDAEQPADRPRVAAYFVEPDDAAEPLLVVLGRVVMAVAGLEKSLQLELSRMTLVRHATGVSPTGELLREKLDTMDRMTAGRLLRELREAGLPSALDQRIGAVIDRRNRLVHHTYEDPELVKAVRDGGDALAATLTRLERLALDAGELAVELQLFAVPQIESMLGMSLAQVADAIMRVDPSTIANATDRRQLEAVQAFEDVDQLRDALADVIAPEPQRTPGSKPQTPPCTGGGTAEPNDRGSETR